MFEDILGHESTPIMQTLEVGVCPYCGSSTVEEGSGIFNSKRLYVQDMGCQSCSATWKVHYNEDLEIVEIVY